MVPCHIKWNCISCPFVVVIAVLTLGQCLAQEWQRDLVLDKDNRFLVQWSVSEDEILFKVQCKAKGYVALGLSHHGTMMGSDIVTGWIVDGKVHFQDRHGIGNVMPEVDASQDWEILYGSENETHTVLMFKRKLQTCDEVEDLEIKDENVMFIYAYSDEDPVNYQMLQYHKEKKGIKRVLLLQKDVTKTVYEEHLQSWDAKGKPVVLPADVTTTSWCHIVKIPDLQEKHHIVRAELLITAGNKAYIHHITLYSAEGMGLEPLVGSGGFDCKHPPPFLNPNNIYEHTGFVLGIGAEALDTPSQAGVPFGNNQYKYYKITIHYENPSHIKGIVDDSGFRLFYTRHLRPFDMGRWFPALHLNSPFVIPPRRKAFVLSMHDDMRCAPEIFLPHGIRIVGALVHMHGIGSRGSIRHFRQGRELKPILDNVNYDYLYQNVFELREEVAFLPGDQMTVECVFDSSDRNETTFAGGASAEEMCLGTINYYPVLPYFQTMSGSSRSLMLNLLGYSTPERGSLAGQSFLKNLDWTKVDIANYENALRYSPREVSCLNRSGMTKHGLISYPVNLQPYKRSNACSDRMRYRYTSVPNAIIKATAPQTSSATSHVLNGSAVYRVLTSGLPIALCVALLYCT